MAKEKGTQVIEHFLHTNGVDDFVRDIHSSVSLTTVQQTTADYLCEEIANFSFYYQTYCHFVCTTIYKQCGQNSLKHLQRIQKQLQFEKVDEMLQVYLQLERFMLKNALATGIKTD